MNFRFRVVTLCLAIGLSACVGHYRYESRGTVVEPGGSERSAVLYWYSDEGRLWYGPSYAEHDSDIEVLVCEMTPKSFVPSDSDRPELVSRSGDQLAAEVDSTGQVVWLEAPVRLRPGSDCGSIQTADGTALPEDLTEGETPQVLFLCHNPGLPERYPKPDLYAFGPVTQTEVIDNEAPQNVCAAVPPAQPAPVSAPAEPD